MALPIKPIKMRSKKGQTTVEMIVVVGLILVIFTIAVLTAHKKTVESNDFKMALDAKRIVQSVADNINTIAEQGSNYYRFFTLPPYISGGHNYSINIYGNFVEITWESRYGEQSYITQIITANASLHCLDRGGDTKNKVFNYNERILVTCNRADLMVLKDSFRPDTAQNGTDVNISVDILNYGVLDVVTPFNVTFVFKNSSHWNQSREITGGIKADRTITVNVMIPNSYTELPAGKYSVEIEVDPPPGKIYESYEGDNFYNATLTLTEW